MADPFTINQWSTATPLISSAPSWVGEYHADRIASYLLYESIYWNYPTTFQLLQRGTERPLYVPSGRKIVETINRYTANKAEVVADPLYGSETERAASMQWLSDLFARERFYSKFNAEKRYGIIRGDWIIRILGDGERQQGSRLSIEFVDPARYFPIEHPDNPDLIIGVHLIDVVEYEGEQRINRKTYMKQTGAAGPSPITYKEEIYEVDEWGGPGVELKSPVAGVVSEYVLPQPIDHIPLYHLRNFEETGSVWGSSEMRGMETLIAALNQTITDEDLAVALDGIGCYTTNAARPINPDTGEEVPWIIGPGIVLEMPSGDEYKFNRIEGVKSLEPFQDHMNAIERWLDVAGSIPGVAVGDVDVKAAESGVALSLQLAPILDRGEEKELSITAGMNQFLYDLRSWARAYEGQNFDNIRWSIQYGEKLPINKEKRFDQLMEMAGVPGLVSMKWVREQLAELGYDMPDNLDMMAQIIQEKQALGQVEADVLGSRIDTEIGNVDASGEQQSSGSDSDSGTEVVDA